MLTINFTQANSSQVAQISIHNSDVLDYKNDELLIRFKSSYYAVHCYKVISAFRGESEAFISSARSICELVQKDNNNNATIETRTVSMIAHDLNDIKIAKSLFLNKRGW